MKSSLLLEDNRWEKGNNKGWYFFCILLALYLLAPNVFEKKLYLNEFFSLLGFICFLRYKRARVFGSRRYISVGIIIFMLVGLMHVVLSPLFYEVNTYGYLRNTQIFYSCFTFYLGLYFFDFLIRKSLPKIVLPVSMAVVCFTGVSYLFTVLLPGMVRGFNKRKNYFWGIALLTVSGLILHSTFLSGGTQALIFFSICFMIIISRMKNKKIFMKLCLAILLVLIATVFYQLSDLFDLLMTKGFSSFFYASQMAGDAVGDANVMWRLGLWATLITERFPDWIVGLGFGTPLFPEGLEKLMSLHSEDPYYQYTVGAHNSFVTIWMRMGVVGLLALVMMYVGFYKIVVEKMSFWLKSGDMLRFSTVLGVVVVTVHALFNVVIESPIYSTTFWLAWGMFFRASAIEYQQPLENRDSIRNVMSVRG